MKLKILAFAVALTLAINLSAQTFTVLHTFTGGNDGGSPYAGLILSGNTLYGTARDGGSSGHGTVFAVNTNGTRFTNLHSFTGYPSDGAGPMAGLILSGNTLYGTTSAYFGGSADYGTVFAVNTDGTGFTNLYSFRGGSDGAIPYAGLILSGNTLYGTTINGGSSGVGTVFAVNTDGSGFTNVYSFASYPSGVWCPLGGLILSGDTLYGTVTYTVEANWSTLDEGAVFAVNTDGSDFNNLYNFTTPSGSYPYLTNSDGASPHASLILSGNTLYGTTQLGGANGNGTVFKVSTDGTGFTTLHSFTWSSDGALPFAGLILSGNTLYGTTWAAGSSGCGTVFALSLVPSTPIITTQPQSQMAQAGNNVTFTVNASDYPPPSYQWQFNGQNIPNATNATLTLNSVTAANSGGYSVVVSNPYGSVTSATASLAVLSIDTSVQCFLMTATPLPPKQPGKNNLVVVTHGWERQGTRADISWITNLCNAISNQLVSLGSNDWQVVPYAWLDKASGIDTALNNLNFNFFSLADNALHDAEKIGTQIGEQIAEQGWSHVHLIGHSAGAGLIQKATEAIHKNASGIVVHTTFLDPFLGLDYHGLSEYGTNAEWSDNYFDHDIATGSYTEGILPNCYNVNVTWAEPSPTIVPIYAPADSGSTPSQVVGCYAQTPLQLSHEYPHDYYQETVLGTEKNCAIGLGFSLSKEDGGWNNRGNYIIGHLSSSCEQCPNSPMVFNQLPLNFNSQVNLSFSPYATSLSGASILDASAFTLNSSSSQSLPQVKSGGVHPLDNTSSTNTPAWLAVGVTITNAVNFVQFDAGFTDTNAAEGLLTVYWNTNQVGMVDERVAETNLQTYRFALPGTVSSGLYTLSFRLDSFANSSSIAVTNVATGFVGVTQPISLGLSLTNGAPLLQLTAATNFTYLIQSSTNLVDWTPTALLLNTNGTVQFTDSAVTNSGARFYRAVMP